MKREPLLAASPVLVPGVVSLAASSRRTLKHGDSFAMFDEFGDVFEFAPHRLQPRAEAVVHRTAGPDLGDVAAEVEH